MDNNHPCQNPNCKSYGRPHPNCKCGGGAMASGGKVGTVCESNMPHMADCSYFADGGGVAGEVATPSFEQTTPTGDQGPSFESTQPVSDNNSHNVAVPPSFDDTEAVGDDKYGTPGQMALTALEGAGQGVAGPIATGAEQMLSKMGVPGLTNEDIAGRQATNPITHGVSEFGTLAGSALTGTGLVSGAARAAEALAPEAVSVLGKVGSAALANAINMGTLQASDEVSKAMLGQGDPNVAVSGALANIGGAALVGAAGGGLFNAAGQAAEKSLGALASTKLGEKATSWLAGIGHAADPLATPENVVKYAVDAKWFKSGQEFQKKIVDKAISGVTGAVIGGSLGEEGHRGLEGALIGAVLGPYLDKMVGKPVGKMASAAALKALSVGEGRGLLDVLNYAASVQKGVKAMDNGVKAIFNSGSQQLLDGFESNEKDRKKLDDAVSNNELNDQVRNAIDPNKPSSPIAAVFPDQDAQINAAKQRIHTYLTAIKPQPAQGLPYDKHLPPDAAAQRSYDRALDIANEPLSILKSVHSGTLTTGDLTHFQAMYPELKSELTRKMNIAMTGQRQDEEMMPYGRRMSMSLFLGAPLDSTMTPQSIQAAQPLPNQTPQPSGKSQKPSAKAGTDLAKGAKSYQTTSQSAESDRASRT